MSVDIHAQIGVVVLVTRMSKNAILLPSRHKMRGLLSAMLPLMLRGPGYGRFS